MGFISNCHSVCVTPTVPQFSQYGDCLQHLQFRHSNTSSALPLPDDRQTVKLCQLLKLRMHGALPPLTVRVQLRARHNTKLMVSSTTVVTLQYSNRQIALNRNRVILQSSVVRYRDVTFVIGTFREGKHC
jgi:hypothetical protein